MTVLSPEPIDSIMQDSQASENSETNSNKTSEIAMTHLEEVIQHVVEEAIDYAEKPPEERTLPTLVRKVPPPPKPRPTLNVMNFANQGMNQSSSHINVGINMAQQFAMKGQNIPSQAMVQFNQVVQQNPHMVAMQYNGGQYNANQLSQAAQLQQQYAQQFQLQQQAQQYQNTQSAAFAQMQQIQQQQAALAAVGPALVYATNISDGQLNGNSSNQRGQNSLSHQLSNGSGNQNGQNQGNAGNSNGQSAVAATVQLTPQQAVAMQQAQMNAVYQLQTSGQQSQAATAVLAANQRWANAAAAAANQQYSQNTNQGSGQNNQSNQNSQEQAQLAHALQLQQQQQAQQQQAQYMDAHRDQIARYVAYQQQQQAQQQNQ